MPMEGSGPKRLHKREVFAFKIFFVRMDSKLQTFFAARPNFCSHTFTSILTSVTTTLPTHGLLVSVSSPPSCRPIATREDKLTRK